MKLSPRQAAFIKKEMQKIENSESRWPTEKREAKEIREKIQTEFTE